MTVEELRKELENYGPTRHVVVFTESTRRMAAAHLVTGVKLAERADVVVLRTDTEA